MQDGAGAQAEAPEVAGGYFVLHTFSPVCPSKETLPMLRNVKQTLTKWASISPPGPSFPGKCGMCFPVLARPGAAGAARSQSCHIVLALGGAGAAGVR